MVLRDKSGRFRKQNYVRRLSCLSDRVKKHENTVSQSFDNESARSSSLLRSMSASPGPNAQSRNVNNSKPADYTGSDFVLSGRRIVDINFLVEQMKSGCFSCGNNSLNLCDIVREKRYGLGSILVIKCNVCHVLNDVFTGMRHHDINKKKTSKVFDVNTKAAAGIYFNF